MSDTTTAPADGTSAEPSHALDRAALLRTYAARAAIDVESTPRYTLDATWAVGTALSTSARVKALRPQLLTLPGFDIGNLDHLEDLARGLRCVHTEILGGVAALNELPEQTQEGYELRGLLLSSAETLSYKGRVPKELIARIREGTGRADLVEDLNVLVQVHLKLPAGFVGDDMAVTPADLERATDLAHLLNQKVGARSTLDMTTSSLHDERRKLAGMLLAAQDQLRRGVTYLRWEEDDAAEWVPSLYVPNSGRKTEASKGQPPSEPAPPNNAAHEDPPLAPEDNPFAPEE